MEFVDFEVERRSDTGKGVARRLRRQGQMPAIFYGDGDPIPLTVDPKGLLRALGTEAGGNAIFNLTIAGEKLARKAMVKEVQVDPVTGALLHADLLAISMERPIDVEVPLELVGVAKGVKDKGGILEQILRELKVRCLPGAIPDKIATDVSSLDIGDVLHVNDLAIPDGVELLTEWEQVIVTVAAPAVEVAPLEEEVAAPTAAEESPEPGATREETAKPGAKTPPKKE